MDGPNDTDRIIDFRALQHYLKNAYLGNRVRIAVAEPTAHAAIPGVLVLRTLGRVPFGRSGLCYSSRVSNTSSLIRPCRTAIQT